MNRAYPNMTPKGVTNSEPTLPAGRQHVSLIKNKNLDT